MTTTNHTPGQVMDADGSSIGPLTRNGVEEVRRHPASRSELALVATIDLMRDRAIDVLEALEESAKSLEALSTAGARTGSEYLQDMIDVRGYAASRAREARAAIEKATKP